MAWAHSVLEPMSQLLGAEDSSVAAVLASVLTADGIDVRLNTVVTSAEPCASGARLHLSDGADVKAERILLATGRTPNTSRIGLEALGIGDDRISIDERGQVFGHEHLWAAGDVTAIVP